MIDHPKKDLALLPATVISNPNEPDSARHWQGIPGIERTKNGRLFFTFYSGGVTEQAGNYVLLLKSDDDGSTFSPPLLKIKTPAEDCCRCFDPCLWIDPLGKLWLFYAQSYAFAKPRMANMDGRMGVWAVVCEDPDSPDLQFSAPRRIANGVMMNKPTVLENGQWLLPCYIMECEEVNSIPEEKHPNVYVSPDNGKTFSLLGHSEYSTQSCAEHMLLERRDGSLLMLIRTNEGIAQSISHDGGHTWGEDGDSGLGGPCTRFCIRKLKSGNVMLINHWRFTGRNNLTAMLSQDDGETWKGFFVLDERDNVSYPDVIQAEDGRIYVAYDRERWKAREILFAVLTEEDILAGHPVTAACRLKQLVNRATGM